MYNFDLGKRKYSTGKTREETSMRVPLDFTFHFCIWKDIYHGHGQEEEEFLFLLTCGRALFPKNLESILSSCFPFSFLSFCSLALGTGIKWPIWNWS